MDAGTNTADEGKVLPSAVGTELASPVTTMVGPDGGVVFSEDRRVEVVVPPGALSAATAFSIGPVTSSAPGAIGPTMRITTPTQTFAQPLQLKFHLGQRELNGVGASTLGVGFQNANGYWQKQAASFDAQTRTLTATVTHLSDWTALAGTQLLPGTATVKTGSTLMLEVSHCEVTNPSMNGCMTGAETPETCVVAQCRRTTLPSNTFMNWAVNGVAGGNGEFGTVSGQDRSGLFTAPGKVPQPEVVAVSVTVNINPSVVHLVSNITILDLAVFEGHVYFGPNRSGAGSGEADFTFERTEDLPDVATFKLTKTKIQTSTNFDDCDNVNSVFFMSATGTLTQYKGNSGLGKNHVWLVATPPQQVTLNCGMPRRSTVRGVGLSLSITTPMPYANKDQLSGTTRIAGQAQIVDWVFSLTK